MIHQCPNCKSVELEFDDVPPWNAPASHRQTIILKAKCLGCGKRLQNTNIFNTIEEYMNATKDIKQGAGT